MTSSNINLCSSFSCLNKIRHIWVHPNYHRIWWGCETIIFKILSFLFNVLHNWMMKSFFKSYFSIFYVFVIRIKGHFLSMSSSISSFQMWGFWF
jgi:hypothetical protein